MRRKGLAPSPRSANRCGKHAEDSQERSRRGGTGCEMMASRTAPSRLWSGIRSGGREAPSVVRDRAVEQFVDLDATDEQVNIVLPGEADTTVYL